ncbi:FMN-binding protein [Sulfurirhabdus autotrophica]|uniref:FMN-binding protein n=1 Tax=Sulfurirhabdus autotrophica TaxID=1706046 RepID=A0A4R3YEK2_9PROT|nr:FMN-binding protein [Sulfurirhabdus autotrophica]TCV90361.1 FMN-binding protein [Sulfurirhabdus autotrophica]
MRKPARSALTMIVTICVLFFSLPVSALDRVIMEPEVFVANAFSNKPLVKTIWLTKNVESQVMTILGHAPTQLRQRYWSDGVKTLWILEEIGKEDLITAGFIVMDGKIDQAKVLVYRESRGMEIKYPAFLNQFKGLSNTSDNRLEHSVDGISGATLSVHAMERMARLALYYDQLSKAK